MFTIVFEIHCSFSIVLRIWLKICRSNNVFSLLPGKMCLTEKSGTPQKVLHAQPYPINIGPALYV